MRPLTLGRLINEITAEYILGKGGEKQRQRSPEDRKRARALAKRAGSPARAVGNFIKGVATSSNRRAALNNLAAQYGPEFKRGAETRGAARRKRRALRLQNRSSNPSSDQT